MIRDKEQICCEDTIGQIGRICGDKQRFARFDGWQVIEDQIFINREPTSVEEFNATAAANVLINEFHVKPIYSVTHDVGL